MEPNIENSPLPSVTSIGENLCGGDLDFTERKFGLIQSLGLKLKVFFYKKGQLNIMQFVGRRRSMHPRMLNSILYEQSNVTIFN